MIAFWNRKGGVGKTTTTGNVGLELSRHGRTLLVDADPQSTLTSWLVPTDVSFDLELVDVLRDKAPIDEAVLAVRHNLYILPSFAIDGELQGWGDTEVQKNPFAFADFAEKLTSFDYVLLDMHPGDSMLERTALSACHEIILVGLPELFSHAGIQSAYEVLDSIKKQLRGKARYDRIIINRINKRYSAHQVLLESAEQSGKKVYPVGQSQSIHDAAFEKKFLAEFDPKNSACDSYKTIAEALL
jgi:chromosome partitioning protein